MALFRVDESTLHSDILHSSWFHAYEKAGYTAKVVGSHSLGVVLHRSALRHLYGCDRCVSFVDHVGRLSGEWRDEKVEHIHLIDEVSHSKAEVLNMVLAVDCSNHVLHKSEHDVQCVDALQWDSEQAVFRHLVKRMVEPFPNLVKVTSSSGLINAPTLEEWVLKSVNKLEDTHARRGY